MSEKLIENSSGGGRQTGRETEMERDRQTERKRKSDRQERERERTSYIQLRDSQKTIASRPGCELWV